MDIQTSIFHANRGVEQEQMKAHLPPAESATTEKRAVLQERGVGNRSVEVMDRLTQKLVNQSENTDRVEAIKAKIAAGTFEIDPGKIADKLLWGERIAAYSENRTES